MGSSSSSELHIPMVDDSKFLHGRVDPGREDSLLLVESIPDIPTTRLDGSDTGKGKGKCQAALSDTQEYEEIVRPSAPSPTQGKSSLSMSGAGVISAWRLHERPLPPHLPTVSQVASLTAASTQILLLPRLPMVATFWHYLPN